MTFFYVTISLRNIKKNKKKHKILEIYLKSATIIQYTIKGRFMNR